MKYTKVIAVIAILGLSIGGIAIAQIHRAGAHGNAHGILNHFKDAPSAVKHIAETFPKVAAFDANKDGELNATEREAVATAITEGKLTFPGHASPDGAKPGAEKIMGHLPDMYARISTFDLNHDGELNAAEQAALQIAIEKGEVPGPHTQ